VGRPITVAMPNRLDGNVGMVAVGGIGWVNTNLTYLLENIVFKSFTSMCMLVLSSLSFFYTCN